MNETENFTGALLEDPRTPKQQSLDHTHEEQLGMANPINWVEKPESEWVKLSLLNQNGGFYCGGEAGAKATEVLIGTPASAHPIYRARTNYPSEGMWIQDIGNNLKNESHHLY